ncbi:L-lactate dehydrogenase [Erysipelotrichaceae bacterium AF15-26LB]|nr:L-lactate dehydrogenase [Erysipelotrichaceae bacterium 3_1_53]MCR0347655.1 L-lactate dehydrogenase [[Clostridium] innocuum]RJV89907.1 L-lactate dehydrogenase [Erysipelotrichaceae bacterium AF15-26LB]RJV90678.1 L-lactate dehydrogenase [Erysipelotrichaceae bacterium AF19-24AC]
MSEKRKIVLVGTGFVGMSMAYSFLSTGGIDELVLIDVAKEKAVGEAMDLQHGLPYARGKMDIYAGDYEDCRDASVIVITAGAAQKPEETRLDLTAKNARIMKSVVESIMASGFDGILVVASNPVDGMTYLAQKVSGLPKERVIGSGTILDTARLRYMMSEYLDVSSSNIHAYIMGEHGDSSFVPWTHAYVGSKSLLELLDEQGKPLSDLHDIYTNVQQAAYEIINRKKATFYGIGLSLNRLVHAILDDENVILTISAYQEGEYGQKGLYIGVPAVVNRQGIREVIRLKLNEVDQAKFNASCDTLKGINRDVIDPLL